jgi:hypothetical protein
MPLEFWADWRETWSQLVGSLVSGGREKRRETIVIEMQGEEEEVVWGSAEV